MSVVDGFKFHHLGSSIFIMRITQLKRKRKKWFKVEKVVIWWPTITLVNLKLKLLYKKVKCLRTFWQSTMWNTPFFCENVLALWWASNPPQYTWIQFQHFIIHQIKYGHLSMIICFCRFVSYLSTSIWVFVNAIGTKT